MMNYKYFQGSGHGLILSTIPKFAWRDWEKLQDNSDSITGRQAEIWNRDLPNTKQEY
jgi:hypothetical protein